ncbi:hypothetical protein [Neorhodopirellula lusitana]|uniref:hypothetical protein n=1 Tax=Neorhodopirellula lusitana TaxID=445327 RepID=UPI00384EBEFA
MREINVKHLGHLFLALGLFSTLTLVAGCGNAENRQSSAGMTEEEMQAEFEATNAANEAAANDTAIPE